MNNYIYTIQEGKGYFKDKSGHLIEYIGSPSDFKDHEIVPEDRLVLLDTNKWFYMRCEACGYEDSSKEFDSCAIADTGDFSTSCPKCYSDKVDEYGDYPSYEGVIAIRRVPYKAEEKKDLRSPAEIEKSKAEGAAEVQRLKAEQQQGEIPHDRAMEVLEKTFKRLASDKPISFEGEKDNVASDNKDEVDSSAALHSGQGNAIDQLVNAYDDYISILNEEIESLIGMAYIHGWKSSNVERGAQARAQIKAVLNSVLSQQGSSSGNTEKP